MEVDKDNKFLSEMGSYEVGEGREFVTKFFYKEGKINLYFDTGRDVEEWEFDAIYDLIDAKSFEEKGYKIEDKIFKLRYDKDNYFYEIQIKEK